MKTNAIARKQDLNPVSKYSRLHLNEYVADTWDNFCNARLADQLFSSTHLNIMMSGLQLEWAALELHEGHIILTNECFRTQFNLS